VEVLGQKATDFGFENQKTLPKFSQRLPARNRLEALSFKQLMSTDTNSPKANNEIRPFVSEKMHIEVARDLAKRLRLSSLEDLLEEKSSSVVKALQLLRQSFQEDDPDASNDLAELGIAESVFGVIPLKGSEYWLFFHRSDKIYEGADAISVKLAKTELSESAPNNILVDADLWTIEERKPLLLRSMYGAILGFRKETDGIVCQAIHEGDDGWT
jgi:hypothetical protein